MLTGEICSIINFGEKLIMYQKKAAEKIVCPQCGGGNSPEAKVCFNCESPLLTETKKNNLKLVGQQLVEQQPNTNKEKRKFNRLSIAISLGVLVAVGLGLGYRSSTLLERQVEKKELKSDLAQLQGILRVWSPPNSKNLLNQLIVEELSHDGSLTIAQMDIGNRSPIDELKYMNLACALLDRNSHFKQLKEAEKLGYKAIIKPIAIQAGVYLVNAQKTGVKFLTMEQVAQIYRGEITNWQQVGGEDLPIVPILLAQQNFLNINFKNQLNPNTKFVKTYDSVIKALKKYDGGFGYTFSLDLVEKEKGIEAIPLENESGKIISPLIPTEAENKPNLAAFANGSYPELRSIKLVHFDYGRTYEGLMAESLGNYFVSKEGQKLLRKLGYVSLQSIQSALGNL